MTIRYTKRSIKAAIAAALAAGNPMVSLALVIAGKPTDPKWTAQVRVSDAQQGTDSLYLVGDDAGKVRYFPTVDSAVKFLADVAEDGEGQYSVNALDTGAFFASKVPADIYKDAESKVLKLGKVSLEQAGKRAALEALVGVGGAMHGWNNGNAAQRARYEETVDQMAALLGDMNAVTAEIARLNALIASRP